MRSRIADWIEGEPLPVDDYQLAGLARFHPSSEDVVQGLDALAVANQAYRAHWRPQLAARSAEIQSRIEAGLRTFTEPTARQSYDEGLWSLILKAYVQQFPPGPIKVTHDAVRRWLRLIQNVHATRIDESTLRLMRTASAVGPHSASADSTTQSAITAVAPMSASALPPTPAIEIAPGSRASAQVAPPPSRPGPSRPADPDDYGLLWIIGSATVTAVISLTLLLALAGDRIGMRGGAAVGMAPATDQNDRSGQEFDTAASDSDSADIGASGEPFRPTDAEGEPAGPAIPPKTPNPVASHDTASPASPPHTPPSSTPKPASPSTNSSALPNSSSGRPTLAFGQAVHALTWDGAGKQLAVGGEGSELQIWNVGENASRRLSEGFTSCTAVAFSPNGRFLAAAASDGPVFVWNMATWKRERTIRHEGMTDPRSLAWLDAGPETQLAVGDGSGIVRLFGATTGNLLAVLDLNAPAGPVQTMVVPSRSRPILVAGHLDGTIAMWNLAGNRSLQRSLIPQASIILDMLVQSAAAAAKGAELTLCDHETCYAIGISPDEKLLAIAARDLELWEIDTPRFLIRKRQLPGNDVQSYRLVAFSGKGDLLATATASGKVSIIDVASWSVLWQEDQPAAVLATDWHPTELRLAIGSADGRVTIVPVTKIMLSQRAAPDFEAAKVLATAGTLVSDESWFDCSRLINVLTAFRVSQAEKLELDRLRLIARKQVKALIDEIEPGTVTVEQLDDATQNLQLAIDLDSTGPLGRHARDLMRQLPARVPSWLAKAASDSAQSTIDGSGEAVGRPPSGRKAKRP